MSVFLIASAGITPSSELRPDVTFCVNTLFCLQVHSFLCHLSYYDKLLEPKSKISLISIPHTTYFAMLQGVALQKKFGG